MPLSEPGTVPAACFVRLLTFWATHGFHLGGGVHGYAASSPAASDGLGLLAPPYPHLSPLRLGVRHLDGVGHNVGSYLWPAEKEKGRAREASLPWLLDAQWESTQETLATEEDVLLSVPGPYRSSGLPWSAQSEAPA